MTKLAGVLATLLGLVLVGALIIGGYQLGWWLKKDSTNRTAKINNDSYNRQTGLVQDVMSKAADIANIDVQLTQVSEQDKPALEAQRRAILNQFCYSYGQLTGTVSLPNSVRQLASEC